MEMYVMYEPVGNNGEVYVVDDDSGVRTALSAVFSRNGYVVTGVPDGASFLALARGRVPACVLLDVYLPGRSGLDILRELNADDYAAPVIVMSGQGDIPMAVEAIRNGALDFIEKPFHPDTVVERVRDAIAAWERRRNSSSKLKTSQFPGRDLLTRREFEVLEQISTGASSKEVARLMGISFRTVEVHRSRIMEKLGAKNSVDLMRIVLT